MTSITNKENQCKTSTFRNTIFWLLGRIKGSNLSEHYTSIKRINKDHESDYAIRERKKHLSDILLHSLETVPYYNSLGITATSLDLFPVVDKNRIRLNAKSFCSIGYANKKTFNAVTSGSTGTPFNVLQDADKKRRHALDVRFFWESVGHPWGSRFYYLKIWNKQNKKSQLTQKIQNIVPVDVFKMNDQKIKELLRCIKSDNSPKSILSYASALDRIVKYLERNPIDMSAAGIISIIAMSESLDGPTKKKLTAYFGCPVVSRYANTENGMIAQQTALSGNDFLLNLASYHIEILDIQEDLPARDGETGRIVVTDLFNRAMPLIRYDTGDFGVLGKSKNNERTQYVLKMVAGRKMDIIYNTGEDPISSFTITNNMWKYVELDQYQFIQIRKTVYEFRLNLKGIFKREAELIKEFKGYLGQDASITITYVDEIPLLSSGKRKKVLNRTEINNNIKKEKSYAI